MTKEYLSVKTIESPCLYSAEFLQFYRKLTDLIDECKNIRKNSKFLEKKMVGSYYLHPYCPENETIKSRISLIYLHLANVQNEWKNLEVYNLGLFQKIPKKKRVNIQTMIDQEIEEINNFMKDIVYGIV